MQDRYAGDLGDYGKLGLLRALAASGLRVGLAWYLVPDEHHNGDGRHVRYLDPASPQHDALRHCDPDLHDRLRDVVASERSVAALQAAGVLPPGARYADERLDLRALRGRAARLAHRVAGAARWQTQLAPCDVVCVDPDNGLERPSVGRVASKGPKYACLDELAPLATRGQSVVVYQHTDRSAPATVQAARRAEALRRAVAPDRPVHALLFRRGSCRIYLISPAPPHADRIRRTVDTLLAGPWSAAFERAPGA